MKKYIHTKTSYIVEEASDSYTSIGNVKFSIPKEIVENSNDWKIYNEISNDIQDLMNKPVLSINDVGKVFVTANRTNFNKDFGLEPNALKLIEIVKEKLSKYNI